MTMFAAAGPQADVGDGWDAAPRGVFAALDLGTNNCRLLLAVPATTGFRVVDSFSRIVRLGEGLSATGTLGEGGMARAMDALHLCVARLRRRPVRGLRAVATEACRQASNGAMFLHRVRRETGLGFEVISPRQEAQLALESCADLISPEARRVLLFDIGGGSTELAWVRPQGPDSPPELIGYQSLPVGVVSLAERHGDSAGTEAGFEAMVQDVRQRLSSFEDVHRIRAERARGGVQVIGTSGTVTTLAGVAMRLPRYRRPLVDGVVLGPDTALAALAALRALGPDGLRQHPCVGVDRAEFVLPGCAVFEAIRRTWSLGAVTVADRGLREGLLLRMMREAGIARRTPACAVQPV